MPGNKKNKTSAMRGRSIDGIISDGRPLGGLSAKPFHPNRNQPADSIGSSLRRAEGFHPMRSGSGSLGLPAGRRGVMTTDSEANLVLDEPIILDELATSKNDKQAHRGRRSAWSLKRTALTLLALIVAGGLFMGIKFYIIERHLFRGGGGAPALASNINVNNLRGEGDGRVNILLLGIGGPGHDGANLTDTILLASIDPINNKVALLSIPRDLWVKIPGDGYQKINAAYAYGKNQSKAKTLAGQERDGLNLLDNSLSPVLGIPIHYHAVVNFKAFQQGVEAVGGVDANVPKELAGREEFWIEGTNRHYTLNVQPGQQHFDGTKALYFARERHDSSDFVRSQRQRLLLSALKDKTLSLGTFSNPIKISNLLSSFGDNVYTDFSVNDITRLYQIIQKVPSGDISSLDLVTPPHDLLTTGNLDGLSIVRPKTGLFDYSDIQNFVRNTLRDGLLIKENAPVAIYNATSVAGLATKEAKLLKSYGYNVTTVDNLPKATDPAKSILIDLSNSADKYTRHYLEQRLGLAAQNSLPAGAGIAPPSGTKFVIIVGKDAQNSLQ